MQKNKNLVEAMEELSIDTIKNPSKMYEELSKNTDDKEELANECLSFWVLKRFNPFESRGIIGGHNAPPEIKQLRKLVMGYYDREELYSSINNREKKISSIFEWRAVAFVLLDNPKMWNNQERKMFCEFHKHRGSWELAQNIHEVKDRYLDDSVSIFTDEDINVSHDVQNLQQLRPDISALLTLVKKELKTSKKMKASCSGALLSFITTQTRNGFNEIKSEKWDKQTLFSILEIIRICTELPDISRPLQCLTKGLANVISCNCYICRTLLIKT